MIVLYACMLSTHRLAIFLSHFAVVVTAAIAATVAAVAPFPSTLMLSARNKTGSSSSSNSRLLQLFSSTFKTLHQRLIAVTLVLLLASGLILAHTLLSPTLLQSNSNSSSNSNSNTHTTHLTPTTLSVSPPLSSSSSPHLIDLTPPLSRQSLGAATWSLLHTIAALFPEEPSLAKQEKARELILALAEIYPCATCE